MFSIVAAMDMHGLIGKNNDLPWHYPEDLKYFKKLTLNHKVLMGRKTFESIVDRLGHPLPKRDHLVATRQGLKHQNIEIINNLETFLSQKHEDHIFIIGGKEVFDLALPFVDQMFITHVKHIYQGDTYLQIDFSKFRSIKLNETEDLLFMKYERIQV